MNRAKQSYTQSKRDFPQSRHARVQDAQNQAIAYLVQQEKYQKADDLDVEVTDKEVDERLDQLKQQYFQGKDEAFQKNLKDQGLTEEQVRIEIESRSSPRSSTGR